MDEKSLFLEALDIEDPREREVWIEAKCAGDPRLQRRVKELLARHSEAESFLEAPAPELQATMLEEHNPSVSHPSVLKSLGKQMSRIPQIALKSGIQDGRDPVVRTRSSEIPSESSSGRYQLLGEIARGGMGAILKGRDADLGRDLALKVLLDEHAEKPHVIQRFVEEAQIGGQLQHPGIVPVYELGQFNDQRPFFTMKLVKGKTLAAHLSGRSDSKQERAKYLGIFEQVCQTLAYTHSRGVIHRDLKPANIMVGAFGEVQVMDWGLAKVLSEGGIADEKKAQESREEKSIIQTIRSLGSDSPVSFDTDVAGSQTQMGSVLGTPAYMPPEQALGEIDRLDERADVFGLGAILCEILTGKPPYVGENHVETFRMASRAKLDECFERLEQSGADQELIQIVHDCLEPEPDDRIRDAGQLCERVTNYLESVENRLKEAQIETAQAVTQADEERKRRHAVMLEERKRRRVLMALAASILVTCGIAGGGWLWVKQKDAALAKAEATQKVEAMAQRQQLARQISGEISTARTLASLDEETLPTAESVDRASAAVGRAVALLDNGDVEEAIKENVEAVSTKVESLRRDFDLIVALDEAWQKEVDYKAERTSWERINQKRGNVDNAQGGEQHVADDGPASDTAPELFDQPNPAIFYESAFADWGLTLPDEHQDMAVEKLKELAPELQTVAFNGLDRWRDLLTAPLKIEEWQQFQWKPLEAVELKSNARETYEVLDDKSILASGPTPHAGYELIFDTDVTEISALRLEAMLHDSLPNRGPGRSSNGKFRSQIRVKCAPLDNLEQIKLLELKEGTADFVFARAFVEWGNWHILGGAGRPHIAVYKCSKSVRSPAGFRIWIQSPDRDRNSQDQWGRMRFSILKSTADLKARQQLSERLAELLKTADNDPWRSEMRAEIANEDVLDLIDRAAEETARTQPKQFLIRLAEYLAYLDNRDLDQSWPEDIDWQLLNNLKLSSKNGTVLSAVEDGVIEASGPNPLNETFTLTGELPVQKISAIRLEVIEDREGFSGDLGRSKHVTLHEVEFRVGNDEATKSRVATPHIILGRKENNKGAFHSTHLLQQAVDGNVATALHIYDGGDEQLDRTILLGMNPNDTETQSTIEIRLTFGANQGQNPRWFRISVTDEAIPVTNIRAVARTLLERAVLNDPTDYRVRIVLSRFLRQQLPPSYDEALRHATAAVALRPDIAGGHAAILESLAPKTLIERSDLQNIARTHCEELRRLSPKHPSINNLVERLIVVGNDFAEKNEDGKADRTHQFAIDLRTSNVQTYHGLISSLVDDGKFPLALHAARTAIEIEPNNPRSLNWMGIIHGRQGNYNEAINWYRKATEVDPTYTLGYQNWASNLVRLNRKDEAIEVLKKAIKVAPLEAQLFDDLGDKLKRAQKPEESIAAYRKATELAPYNGHYRLALVNKLEQERRIDEAVQVWENAIELDPDDFVPRNNLAVLLYDQGRLDEAVNVHLELVHRHPQEEYAHRNLTYTLEIQERFDEAHRAFENWIDQLPGDGWGYAAYGDFLTEQEKFDKAIEMYQTAIQISPRYAYAYHQLGNLLEKEKRFDEAIEVFKREIEEMPRQNWPYASLARLLRAENRFDEVMPIFEKAIQGQPDNASLLQGVSQAISVDPEATVEQAQWAVPLAKKATQLNPEWQYNYRPLGVLQYRIGNYREAIQSLDTYLKIEWDLYKDKTDVAYNVAMALSFKSMAAFKLGEIDRALAYLKEAEGALQKWAFVDKSSLEGMVPHASQWNNWLVTNARRALDEARALMDQPTDYPADEILEKAIDAGTVYVERYPQDSQAFLNHCHLLVHAGRLNEYTELCRQRLDSLNVDSHRATRTRIARASLLAPTADTELLEKVNQVIQLVLETGTAGAINNFWGQTAHGMVQYRMGNYKDAEKSLTPTVNWDADLRRGVGLTALIFRCMARHHLGKHEEAIADFRRAEKKHHSLSRHEKLRPRNVSSFYEEARQLLGIEEIERESEEQRNE